MTEDERLLLLATAAAAVRMLDDGAPVIDGEQRRRLHTLMVKVISADVPRPATE